MILLVSKGSRFSPKQSAQSLFTVFHNILLKCSSTSSSPSCNKWPGLPHYCSLSPAVGGSVQSQMEAKLVSMNLRSPRLKSHMPSFPSTRTINTSAMNHQSLVFDSSSSFLSPDSANFVGNPSDPAMTLAHAEIKAASKAAHRTSAPALASSAPELGTWAGVSSLGQVSERDTPPCKIYPLSLGLPVQTPTFHGQPCYPLSAPLWRSLSRRTIPHHGRWLGGYGEYASLAHVPETVVVCDGKQQQCHERWANGRPHSRQIE